MITQDTSTCPTPFQIHFKLVSLQEVLRSIVNGNAWSAHRSQLWQLFSVCVSLKLSSKLLLHTLSNSILLFEQFCHRSLNNLLSSTSRMSSTLDSSLPPVGFTSSQQPAVCNVYTAVVHLSSHYLPFPFTSLDRRFWSSETRLWPCRSLATDRVPGPLVNRFVH